jgi:hypothetical protein
MRRILVLLSVVALMVVMLAMSVAPAFAAWTGAGGACKGDDFLWPTDSYPPLVKKDKNGDGWLCDDERQSNRLGTYSFYYDNRPA